jgi:hypothetical protein
MLVCDVISLSVCVCVSSSTLNQTELYQHSVQTLQKQRHNSFCCSRTDAFVPALKCPVADAWLILRRRFGNAKQKMTALGTVSLVVVLMAKRVKF